MMSNPGFLYGNQQQQQLTPQQQLAMALMKGSNPNMGAPYGGIASGGSQIANAIAMKNLQARQAQMAPGAAQPNASQMPANAPTDLSSLYSLGSNP